MPPLVGEKRKVYDREYRKTEKYKKMRAAYEEKNKDRLRERRKLYAKEYHKRPHIQKYRKEYREKHRERILEQKRQHYRENKKRILKQQNEYYHKNKEVIALKTAVQYKRWREENKEHVCMISKLESKYLTDNNVKSLLSCPNQYDRKKGKGAIPRELITQEMIEAKREVVTARRLLRQIRKEIRNGKDL